jgi:dissimilatory sulfite reductase (desulfoviridin) alpha/beta subunit
MGKRPRLGDRLPFEAKGEDGVLDIIDATIDWHAVNGAKGERVGDTLDRVGVESLGTRLRGLLGSTG